MALVMIRCAATGHAVSTGIEVEQDTFEALPMVGSRLSCPACGGDHVWTKDEAWIDGMKMNGASR